VRAFVVQAAILAYLEMTDFKEQHRCIRLCFKLGKNAMETLKMSKVALNQVPVGKNTSFWVAFQV